ncbi:hypothetical protein [Sphingobium chungbukense]|uniref:hypothetical protein n=1 Tax=Sphingobium chungbukense TaxID=56193 RepID=UPI000A3FF964|nr:hypothetical protein [Sphingobium chungbukense]
MTGSQPHATSLQQSSQKAGEGMLFNGMTRKLNPILTAFGKAFTSYDRTVNGLTTA